MSHLSLHKFHLFALKLALTGLAISLPFSVGYAASNSISFDASSLAISTPLSPAPIEPLGNMQMSIPLSVSAITLGNRPVRIDQIQLEVDLCDPNLQILAVSLVDPASSARHLSDRSDISDKSSLIHLSSGTASGGRATVLKLTSKSGESLEGTFHFQILVRAPREWRGSAFHLQATAYGHSKKIAYQPMMVAGYLSGDTSAQQSAMQLVNAELKLRESVDVHSRAIARSTAPTVLHQFVNRLELMDPRIPEDWLTRTIFSKVDPYRDPELKRLPVDVRVAVLDYQAAQRAFTELISSR